MIPLLAGQLFPREVLQFIEGCRLFRLPWDGNLGHGKTCGWSRFSSHLPHVGFSANSRLTEVDRKGISGAITENEGAPRPLGMICHGGMWSHAVHENDSAGFSFQGDGLGLMHRFGHPSLK